MYLLRLCPIGIFHRKSDLIANKFYILSKNSNCYKKPIKVIISNKIL
jgi:hypothetical protein